MIDEFLFQIYYLLGRNLNINYCFNYHLEVGRCIWAFLLSSGLTLPAFYWVSIGPNSACPDQPPLSFPSPKVTLSIYIIKFTGIQTRHLKLIPNTSTPPLPISHQVLSAPSLELCLKFLVFFLQLQSILHPAAHLLSLKTKSDHAAVLLKQ